MTPTLQGFKADLFRALGNPVRIQILEALRAAGSLTVSDLQQRLGLEASNISQHLSIMRSRSLVLTQRDGTSIWYSVAEPELFNLLDVARTIFEQQLDAQARMLKADE